MPAIDGARRICWTHSRHQYAWGPVCTNLPEGLWPRVKRLLHVDYSWYLDGTLTHWLDGVRWWENHHTLGHRERMAKLAEAMMYRIPRPDCGSVS